MDKEMHLDIYQDRSILYENGYKQEFIEGPQDETTQKNMEKIKAALDKGFLECLITNVHSYDFSSLDKNTKSLIDSVVAKVTSEVGRALVGLTFLQLTIKSIVPEQCIRLHKGSIRSGAFSWKRGISMRTLDKQYNTPFLRRHGLVNLNADGLMMTRSLAENYPYSRLYKAEMRGPFHEWISIVDHLEDGTMNPTQGLHYLLSVLINRSERIFKLGELACQIASNIKAIPYHACYAMLTKFFTDTRYSARAFEVVIHAFMQACMEMNFTELELSPMSQMRSANKKHGNIGDIELKEGRHIIEAWDAKFGKPYLYEEIGELCEKLETYPGVETAGFIVDKEANKSADILEKLEDAKAMTGTDIRIFNFSEWTEFKLKNVDGQNRDEFGRRWLTATIESFARKRINLAPIDEPCDGWLTDLINILRPYKINE